MVEVVTSCNDCPFEIYHSGNSFVRAGYSCSHPILKELRRRYYKESQVYIAGSVNRKKPVDPRPTISWTEIPDNCPLRKRSVTIRIDD